ncbi:MAG: hypothetical protein Q7S36_01565 [Candidatus Liptonbacteria bacterium]|nr:hypothetical protein [Candidatus Liptonbacteria bacterium]
MGLNTKCPLHGNAHPNYLCPDKKRYLELFKKLLCQAPEAVPPAPCKIHGRAHKNYYCPEGEAVKLWLELLEFYVGKTGVNNWLKTPLSSLSNKTPQSLIDKGRAVVVFNLIADMLTGTPSS